MVDSVLPMQRVGFNPLVGKLGHEQWQQNDNKSLERASLVAQGKELPVNAGDMGYDP